MSRSGYSEDGDDDTPPEFYRQAVDRALQGRRGQAFLREMKAALEALPEKKLIADDLVTENGEVCAIGAVAVARQVDVSGLDPENADRVAKVFGIAESMAREITYINDEWKARHNASLTPEGRWLYVMEWVDSQLK